MVKLQSNSEGIFNEKLTFYRIDDAFLRQNIPRIAVLHFYTNDLSLLEKIPKALQAIHSYLIMQYSFKITKGLISPRIFLLPRVSTSIYTDSGKETQAQIRVLGAGSLKCMIENQEDRICCHATFSCSMQNLLEGLEYELSTLAYKINTVLNQGIRSILKIFILWSLT